MVTPSPWALFWTPDCPHIVNLNREAGFRSFLEGFRVQSNPHKLVEKCLLADKNNPPLLYYLFEILLDSILKWGFFRAPNSKRFQHPTRHASSNLFSLFLYKMQFDKIKTHIIFMGTLNGQHYGCSKGQRANYCWFWLIYMCSWCSHI